MALEPTRSRTRELDIEVADRQRLKTTQDLLKVFESARSYKASLLVQAMRLAEMEGNDC